eukprot:TRINITY_DN8355_c0_g1_i5.p2 TRINITY_DN8355_c0_g1~~TRINITY_DN8355_c0_g1_i5.p2  ORF type:complete len:215 (+),score=26.11 TRINITY_DN8355_c0_g1_i5:2-646(+)
MVWSVCSRARLSWLTVLLYGITLTTSELAATPPRLWSTWYSLNDTMLNETALHSIADTLVSTGMLAAGYDTIMIDDGWQAHHRDADGRLYADPNRFPSGMQAFVQYAADRGLKVGLYTTPGTRFSDRADRYHVTCLFHTCWRALQGVTQANAPFPQSSTHQTCRLHACVLVKMSIIVNHCHTMFVTSHTIDRHSPTRHHSVQPDPFAAQATTLA